MKKLIFFALFICFASFLNGQTKSLGLNTSYSFPNSDDYWITYESPQVGLVYNHFFNGKHGIVIDMGISMRKTESSYPSIYYNLTVYKNYRANYSQHYIFKHKQFFLKSGFNLQVFDFLIDVEETETNPIQGGGTITLTFKERSMKYMKIVPEFHFALGRDFDLGKINLRLNGFVERAFMVDNYIDAGVAAGVFYELGK